MKKAQLIVAGIGPGSPEDMTPAVIQAVKNSDVVIGYKYYFQFIEPYLEPGTECIDTGMKREKHVPNRLSSWRNKERLYALSAREMPEFMAWLRWFTKWNASVAAG